MTTISGEMMELVGAVQQNQQGNGNSLQEFLVPTEKFEMAIGVQSGVLLVLMILVLCTMSTFVIRKNNASTSTTGRNFALLSLLIIGISAIAVSCPLGMNMMQLNGNLSLVAVGILVVAWLALLITCAFWYGLAESGKRKTGDEEKED